MLDHLHGLIVVTEPTRLVLRAAGLGFELLVPLTTSASLQTGEEATVFTHLHISDNPRLLGFASRQERDFCRQLLRVNGVGPAIAIAILSADSLTGIKTALTRGDEKTLTNIRGVGKKTAQRIILDLGELSRIQGDESELPPQSREESDACGALIALGFKEKDAQKAIARARQKLPTAPAGELVRQAISGS